MYAPKPAESKSNVVVFHGVLMLRLTKNYQKLSRLFPNNLARDTSLCTRPPSCLAHAIISVRSSSSSTISVSVNVDIEVATIQCAGCHGARKLQAVAY